MRAFAAYFIAFAVVAAGGAAYALYGDHIGDLAIMFIGIAVDLGAFGLAMLGVLAYGGCLIVDKLCQGESHVV